LGVCVGELDAVELKCTRWNGCPCSDPIVGRTGEVCTRKARFAAREFENTLEVVEVVGVGNRASIFDFACKCRYEAKIPVPARFLTVDLSHSGFPLHEIAPCPLPCIIRIPYTVLVPVWCSSKPPVLAQLVPSPICLPTRTGGVPLPPKRTWVHILSRSFMPSSPSHSPSITCVGVGVGARSRVIMLEL
jgi:hypothetical protein